MSGVTSIVISGMGGQGVLTASDILAMSAFLAGHDVKKSEVKGMSQRGGSVISCVRYGKRIESPLVPRAESDYFVSICDGGAVPAGHYLKETGVFLDNTTIALGLLPSPRTLNLSMLGMLSTHLDVPYDLWIEAIRASLRPRHHGMNEAAFDLGRRAVCS